MKKILSLMLVLMLLVIPVQGAQMDNTDFVVDNADLLTDAEEEWLEELALEVSERWECQTVIITADSLNGKDITDYADDTFDYEGYGYGSGDDGILLAVDMDKRDWAISTYGYGITAFTDYGQECMMDEVLPDLSDGYYYDAFETFLEQCDDLLEQAREGKPLDVRRSGGKSWFSIPRLIFSIAAGCLLALIPMSVLKKEINNVQSQSGAADYVRSGSMKVTQSNDRFLYSHVTKRARPKNNGSSGGGSRTHSSSSGRSHGGSRGKF